MIYIMICVNTQLNQIVFHYLWYAIMYNIHVVNDTKSLFEMT